MNIKNLKAYEIQARRWDLARDIAYQMNKEQGGEPDYRKVPEMKRSLELDDPIKIIKKR